MESGIEFSNLSKMLKLLLGNATELECRFVAIPEAEVQWFHNKKALVESNRIRVENQADMHMYCSIVRISNVSKSDEGTYEVCAKNR